MFYFSVIFPTDLNSTSIHLTWIHLGLPDPVLWMGPRGQTQDQTEVEVRLNGTDRNVCSVPSVVFIHAKQHSPLLTCSILIVISIHASATVG